MKLINAVRRNLPSSPRHSRAGNQVLAVPTASDDPNDPAVQRWQRRRIERDKQLGWCIIWPSRGIPNGPLSGRPALVVPRSKVAQTEAPRAIFGSDPGGSRTCTVSLSRQPSNGPKFARRTTWSSRGYRIPKRLGGLVLIG